MFKYTTINLLLAYINQDETDKDIFNKEKEDKVLDKAQDSMKKTINLFKKI